MEFLKSQVANARMQHQSFVDSLESHEQQADDERFRDLCARHLVTMREHQRELDTFARELGASESAAKKFLGKAVGAAKDIADAARETDYLRLVEDMVMSAQSEETFKTFREAGKTLGNTRLQQIGERGERDHDRYKADASRLVHSMFVEHVRGTTSADVRSTTGARPTNEQRPSM